MGHSCFRPRQRYLWLLLLASTASLLSSNNNPSHALTASFGQPYHGRLINGVPFPRQFQGYQLREEERTYTTPEVVGAILDAIDGVQKQFPGTCDLYMGDFSMQNGGASNHHRSHQNGRDVDLGMYAKGNRPLSTLVPMNEDNLDAAKTWCLIEGIIRSQRVQYIFLDRQVQRILYDYALKQGVDVNYLDRVFGNTRGSIVQHVRNHVDHMHVRFFSPWSTLAAHVGESETHKLTLIEMAQQAYLPKKVQYYANGNERSLDVLAESFGVKKSELCRWNQLHGSEVPAPGTCLVFYKRGFEMEPVHLAQSLQPYYMPEAPSVQFASLGRPSTRSISIKDTSSDDSVSDAPAHTTARVEHTEALERKSEPTTASTVSARRGDTLEKIAKRNKLDVNVLCEANGLKRNAHLHRGQTIKLASLKTLSPSSTSSMVVSDASTRPTGARLAHNSAPAQEPKRHSGPILSSYTVESGDTLPKIAKQKGLDVDTLCYMNGMKKNCALRPGQRIMLARVDTASKAVSKSSSPASSKASSAKALNKKTAATAAKSAASGKPAQLAKNNAPVRMAKASTPIVKQVSAKQTASTSAKNATVPGKKSSAQVSAPPKKTAEPHKAVQKKAAQNSAKAKRS